METPKVLCSIIIRSFNESKHIGKLMDGIRCQTYFPQTEVILVDSGSTDATVEIARSKGAKIVRISPKDFSFGRAINVGCQAAQGEFLLFASAHVYPVYTNWIEKMLLPFADSQVALVYGRQIGNELTKYSEHQIFKKWFPSKSDYNQLHPFCNNANAAVRRELWDMYPYDETLTGLEDLHWGHAIQAKGHKIAYEAAAPIVHVHEESLSKIKNRYMREAIAMKRILPKQKMTFGQFLLLSAGNILSDCFHAVHERVLFKHFSEIVQFRFLQFLGTYQGLRRTMEVDHHLRQRFYYPNEFNRSSDEENLDAVQIDYQLI